MHKDHYCLTQIKHAVCYVAAYIQTDDKVLIPIGKPEQPVAAVVRNRTTRKEEGYTGESAMDHEAGSIAGHLTCTVHFEIDLKSESNFHLYLLKFTQLNLQKLIEL